jgi:hypothetical protein
LLNTTANSPEENAKFGLTLKYSLQEILHYINDTPHLDNFLL